MLSDFSEKDKIEGNRGKNSHNIFVKAIRNIIEIDVEKEISKKRHNSFHHLTVFTNHDFFNVINNQIIKPIKTDEFKSPHKKHIVELSSLKFVNNDNKEEKNEKENENKYKNLKEDKNKKNKSKSLPLLDVSFSRNYITKKKLYLLNGKNNEKKLNNNKTNDFEINKDRLEHNQYYNYYFNGLNLKNISQFFSNDTDKENERNKNSNKINSDNILLKSLDESDISGNKNEFIFSENKTKLFPYQENKSEISFESIYSNSNKSLNIYNKKNEYPGYNNYFNKNTSFDEGNNYIFHNLNESNISSNMSKIKNMMNQNKNNNIIIQNINNINNYPLYFNMINWPFFYYHNYYNHNNYHFDPSFLNYNNSNYNRQMNMDPHYLCNDIYNKFNQTSNDKNSLINDDKINTTMILNLIKTQSGCHFLAEKIRGDHKFANELVFPSIKNNLKEICCNFFSNGLMKTLIDILTDENIYLFLQCTKNNLYEICLNEFGSRIYQNLIQRLYNSPLLLKTFITNLKTNNIGILIKSSYGNHIFHKLLFFITDKEFTNFIFEYSFQNFINIAKDKYGVCFLQKILFFSSDEQRKMFYQKTQFYLDNIMKDCHGNYLIYYIFITFERTVFSEISEIVSKIEENVVDFCKCKYSSSVIEKCFERGKKEISEHIIKYLIEQKSNYIIDILTNSYGFYVIKKIMRIENDSLKYKISNIIINNLYLIKNKKFVNKIIINFTSEYKGLSDLLYQRKQ